MKGGKAMWRRSDLKDRGRIAFRRDYWKCVLVSFVLMLFVNGSSGSVNFSFNNNNDISYDFSYGNSIGNYKEKISEFLINNHGSFYLLWVIATVSLIIILLNIFVFHLLEVGGCRFFIENAQGTSEVGKLLFAFKYGYYSNMVLTLFLRKLYIFLWSLLLIIPGIIKAYEYRMVPYLLADCPQMSREDAFRISKDMMDGQKMEAFLLDLSFLGWILLAAITCGIAGVFYVQPYMNATNAELFLTLRAGYFQKQSQNGVF